MTREAPRSVAERGSVPSAEGEDEPLPGSSLDSEHDGTGRDEHDGTGHRAHALRLDVAAFEYEAPGSGPSCSANQHGLQVAIAARHRGRAIDGAVTRIRSCHPEHHLSRAASDVELTRPGHGARRCGPTPCG